MWNQSRIQNTATRNLGNMFICALKTYPQILAEVIKVTLGLGQLVVDKICSWTVSRFPSTRGIFQSIIQTVHGRGRFAAKTYVVAHPMRVMPKDVLEPCLVSTELWEDKAAPCHTHFYAMVDALSECSQYWVERFWDTPNTFWLNRKQKPSW